MTRSPRSDHDVYARLDPGDTLLVFPDVGGEYTAEVRGIDHERERVKVKLPADPDAPGAPLPASTRWFDRDELEAFDAAGDVLVNPDRGREPAEEPPDLDGGRYGPHEQARDARIARRRAARRL